MNLAKLILIVRDPIDRLVSDYLQIKEKLESENRTVQTLEHLALKDGKVKGFYNRTHMLERISMIPLKSTNSIPLCQPLGMLFIWKNGSNIFLWNKYI